jgi:sulfatase maturation enzyme AslB (radical SAM superfamily)
MTMPPEWFADAYDLMGDAAASRGKEIEHGLQTNMIALERGYSEGVAMDPISELVKQFMDGLSCLPCIFQSNCPDEFISIDARGFVAQCNQLSGLFFRQHIRSGQSGQDVARESRAPGVCGAASGNYPAGLH